MTEPTLSRDAAAELLSRTVRPFGEALLRVATAEFAKGLKNEQLRRSIEWYARLSAGQLDEAEP